MTEAFSRWTATDMKRASKQAEEKNIREQLSKSSDDELIQIANEPRSFWSRTYHTENQVGNFAKRELAGRRTKAFRAEHGLTQKEFCEDHWQTLCAIQHPKERS